MGIRNTLAAWLAPPERRDAGGMWSARGWPAFGGSATSSGHSVSPTLAENLSTVTACVNAVSSALASLPAYVYKVSDNGRTEDLQHPVSRLVRQPNQHQTWADWLEMTIGEVLLRGNALSEVGCDGAGRPVTLTPIPWASVSPVLLPGGGLAFDVTAGAGPPRRLLAANAFHLKDRADTLHVGRSRISRAPEVVGNAAVLQKYAGILWENQLLPSGSLTVDGTLGRGDHDALRAYIELEMGGIHNAKRPLILDRNMKWAPFSVSPEDAEVLASRRFSVEECCRLYGVPGPLVNDLTHGTFTNSETAGRWFSMFTLAPWARKIELEFQRSVFGSASTDMILEIDLSGLQRGSYAERWQANVAAVAAGILTADEVRGQEGWNPLPKAAQP